MENELNNMINDLNKVTGLSEIQTVKDMPLEEQVNEVSERKLRYIKLREALEGARNYLSTADIAKAITETYDYYEAKTITVDLMEICENVRDNQESDEIN